MFIDDYRNPQRRFGHLPMRSWPFDCIEIHIEILADLYRGRQFVIITEIFDEIWNILRFCNYHSNVLQYYLKFIQYCNIKKRKILDILW